MNPQPDPPKDPGRGSLLSQREGAEDEGYDDHFMPANRLSLPCSQKPWLHSWYQLGQNLHIEIIHQNSNTQFSSSPTYSNQSKSAVFALGCPLLLAYIPI